MTYPDDFPTGGHSARSGGIEIDLSDIPEEFRNRVLPASGEVPQYIDFFDVLEEYTCKFPDNVQFVTLKVMTEGDRKQYLNKTNREVKMNTSTKELRMQSAVGDDKHALLELSITGWLVYRAGREVPFNKREVALALDSWPPSLIDMIEKRIREINPWLLGTEDDIEALEEEYAELGKRIETLKERKAKN